MLRINAQWKSRAELDALSNPADPRQPEAVPWVYYDTQALATGAGGPLSFFSAPNADRTLSNLEQGGTIPDPFYFEIVAFNLDYLAPAALTGAGGVAGPVDDLANFLYTNRATFVFTFASKEYLRIPATYLHCSGGPQVFASATLTAQNNYVYAANGFPDGGFYVDKRIVLPPKQSFQMQIVLGGAVTFAATRSFRLNMAGVLHRRVL